MECYSVKLAEFYLPGSGMKTVVLTVMEESSPSLRVSPDIPTALTRNWYVTEWSSSVMLPALAEPGNTYEMCIVER